MFGNEDDIIVSNSKQYIDCFKIETQIDGVRKYICGVGACTNTYSDKSGAIRHLRKHHGEIYNAIKYNKNSSLEEDHTFNPTMELRVKVNPTDIWNACIDLITFDALPLRIVDSSAFQRILKPYIEALKLKGIDLIINRHNIKERISERAKIVKNLIKQETKNKLVSLMTDIASRFNRSVLGVNIAYIKDGSVCVRSIGMHGLLFSHTAAYIATVIQENLSEFDINLGQIVSITTDNGKNMVKSIALLDETYQQQTKSNEFCSEADCESYDFIDSEVFDEEYYSDLLSRVRTMFQEPEYNGLIHGISCAIHCLHLVVTKAIKKSTATTTLVGKCRRLAKILRTPTIRSKLIALGLKMAIIDVETRWNSIFALVSVILFS